VIENPPELVERAITLARLDPDSSVTVDGATLKLREWLARGRELTRIARPLIERLAARSGDPVIAGWLRPENAESLREVFKSRQLIDLLQEFPAVWDAPSLVQALRPLTPRLYSIASSRQEVGEQAHLAVAVIDYERAGERRQGAVSAQLAARGAGEMLRVFIEPNPRFRLPTDGDRALIMIGAGTGVAPYRGFLQARVAGGARGRHWLILGARNRELDFLYQAEWLEALKRGTLQRLDVAFSRDQADKRYVQHCLRENGEALYRALEEGACLYVCGDAERMAADVQEALLDVISAHGGRSRESAQEYLATLASARRFARDVY